jgi:tRNA(Ile2) C34 agmatinyltransferase TiaS
VIYIGLDDTDAPGTLGTKRLARVLAAELAGEYRCRLIVRHQLLVDPRVPCTTKNSTAAIMLQLRNCGSAATVPGQSTIPFSPQNGRSNGQATLCAEHVGTVSRTRPPSLDALIARVGDWVGSRYTAGSDPGLCVTETVPPAVTSFGKRCQRELVGQQEARELAARCGIYLEGFGGTEDGVIGALAAVGLVADGNDGRVLQVGEWPDDLAGPQPVEVLLTRGVEVRSLATGEPIRSGTVDVGKRLRPSYRRGRVVLFAKAGGGSDAADWQGVRLT